MKHGARNDMVGEVSEIVTGDVTLLRWLHKPPDLPNFEHVIANPKSVDANPYAVRVC